MATAASSVATRVQWSSWLYAPHSAVQPSSTFYMTSTNATSRLAVFTEVCNIASEGVALGYTYCNFMDCSWDKGDYIQSVLPCDSTTMTRTVTYSKTPGRSCLTNNPAHPPPSSTSIPCEYAPVNSSVGVLGFAFCAVGVFVCIVFLCLVVWHRQTTIIRYSQPIFVYIFISGAILMNASIAVFIGPNTDMSCILRPWLFDVTTSIMFAPLIMKLRRVDILVNNSKLRKMKITTGVVAAQVTLLILVDIVLLTLWSILETPHMTVAYMSYPMALATVQDHVCSTGITSLFEILMIVWKVLMLAYGVKLVCCETLVQCCFSLY